MTSHRSLTASGLLACVLLFAPPASAQVTQEPIGGQPAPGSLRSNVDFAYQLAYQRAFEALLWSLPRVGIENGRAQTRALGAEDNTILAFSGPSTPKMETITPNSSTNYIVAYTDLKPGPVVLEVPAAGPDGSLYGQVVDAWQMAIADIGPSGVDGGEGGKVLLTGPDFAGPVPEGYTEVKSPNYRITLVFRTVRGPGKTEADAYAYAKLLRMYPLAEAANAPEQTFIDPVDMHYPTLPPYDETYFQHLHDTIAYEPVRPEDKLMLGLLASIGIERGKPYAPDDVTKRAMQQAAIDAWFYLQERFDNLPRDMYFWPDRQYVPLLLPDRNRGFSFDYDDRIDYHDRALAFFWCTTMPAQVSDRPAVYYLMAMADSEGRPLEAGRTYRVTVPADMPVEQFWALTLYDRATMGFIYTAEMRTTLDSYGLERMTRNPDGSVTLYVGPVAPAGLEANWIPSGGKRPLPAFRFYGPKEPLYDRSFKMPDFEHVD